jgi:hypothetical protein
MLPSYLEVLFYLEVLSYLEVLFYLEVLSYPEVLFLHYRRHQLLYPS